MITGVRKGKICLYIQHPLKPWFALMVRDRICIYRILHELSLNINFYETGLGNVIQLAFGVGFSISHDFSACTDPSHDKLSSGFLHVASQDYIRQV